MLEWEAVFEEALYIHKCGYPCEAFAGEDFQIPGMVSGKCFTATEKSICR
jgi:hypothetical protein